MGNNYLLIAEKPDLMRKIQSCYERHMDKIPYTISCTSQRGHLVTLKYPDEIDETLQEWSWETLPIDPKKHGGWQYKVIAEKKTENYMTARERYDYIKREIHSGKYDAVINAGDPDQEGELLVRIVLAHCKNSLPIKRFWTNDLTEQHILHALQNLRDDERDQQLVNLLNAAYGRQHADYLYGMNLSRAATLKMGIRVACGRVKTPILSFVCLREKEIRDFVPHTVYGVRVLYEEGFDGSLIGGDPETADDGEEEESAGIRWFEKKADAEAVIRGLKRALSVTEYRTKRQTKYGPKYYKLATAQIEAGKMGYSASDTLRIIQSLYEKKLLSYPRTSCEYIGGDEDLSEMLTAAGCVPELRKYVDSIQDEDIKRVKKTKTWVNPKALEEEGHSALVPTTARPDWSALDKEEQDIYRMICTQFVASFLPPLVQDRTVLIARTGEYDFRSVGKTLIQPGWTAVYERKHTDTMIPEHKEGDVLIATDYKTTDKTTTCPERFTSADLIAICEHPAKYLDNKEYKKLGKKLTIGTPATRAGIIEELISNDKYLERVREKKREVVVPTKVGEQIIDNIHDCDICKVDLTAEWEEQLERVRQGSLSLEDLDVYMMDRVTKQVSELHNKDMRRIEDANGYQTIGKCPICNQNTLMKGPSQYYCTGYKKGCKAGGPVERYGAKISIKEFQDMLAGRVVTLRMEKGSITWDQKVACDKETGRIIYPGEYRKTQYTCPCCGGQVIESAVQYTCMGRAMRKCGFVIAKEFGGKRVPLEEFERLFETGRSNTITGFRSEKTGNEYAAYMLADKEEKKVVLKFEDTVTPTEHECPVCGKGLSRKGFRYVCGCGFEMPATIAKKELPKATVKKFIRMIRNGEIGEKENALVSKGKIRTPYRCPVCRSAVYRDGMWHRCEDEDCGYGIYRIVSGHIMRDSEIRDLYEKGKTEEITDFVSSKGNAFAARLRIDPDKKKLEYEFADVKKPSGYKCPICGKGMSDQGKLLACECGFRLWKHMSGRDLKDHEIEDIINKGETGYLKFKNRAGKKFEAKVVINREEKKTDFAYRPSTYAGTGKKKTAKSLSDVIGNMSPDEFIRGLCK